MTINLPLNEAAKLFGVSRDTLRNWSKGRAGSTTRPAAKPILTEGEHFFRRGENPNAPYIFKIEACQETLGHLGYLTQEVR